jgi:hypothetical protein
MSTTEVDTQRCLEVTLQVGASGGIVEFVPNAGWLVEGLLSEEECDAIISTCEEFPLEVQHGLSYCNKACFDDSDLATLIQEKICARFASCGGLSRSLNLPISSITVEEEEYQQFLKEWERPSSSLDMEHCHLIEQLRYISYPPGGFIGPHTDGVRVCPITLKATQVTLILYLQHSEAGQTRFLRGTKSDYTEFCAITPQKGSALLFRHQLLHLGDGVGPEGKLLLRGDLAVAERASL